MKCFFNLTAVTLGINWLLVAVLQPVMQCFSFWWHQSNEDETPTKWFTTSLGCRNNIGWHSAPYSLICSITIEVEDKCGTSQESHRLSQYAVVRHQLKSHYTISISWAISYSTTAGFVLLILHRILHIILYSDWLREMASFPHWHKSHDFALLEWFTAQFE